MHKLSKIIILLLVCINLTSSAAEIIGKIEIPSLTDTAQNLTVFTKPISPTIPMMIAGGLIAASFSKKYSSMDINEPLRAGIFANDGDLPPLWCFSVGSRKTPKKEYLKISGSYLFYKEQKKRLLLCKSKALLSTINSLPTPKSSSADISLEFHPKRYLSKCPTHFTKLKSAAINKLSQGKSEVQRQNIKTQVDMVGDLLSETELFNLNISATKKFIVINAMLKPSTSTQLSSLIDQFCSQSLKLEFPDSKSKQGSLSLDSLSTNVDLILKMIAPDKIITNNDKAIFAKVLENSNGSLLFKNGTAILNLNISQQTVKQFIPERYLKRNGSRQRIRF